ncbi:transposase [Chryseobacterium daeguense]|uniref:transposase n=1 Tax=Chryseobacterium daeguense TaxID=412438 RepID=UPI0004142E6D|nr:transposase [Chryseobacterium daeguense]
MKSFKNINVGSLIRQRFLESEMETSRVCNFFNCSEDDVNKMFKSKSIDTEVLLKWSKLLEYDFFRIYSQHLILFSPQSNAYSSNKEKPSTMPQFRKNIYTKEVIDFITELITTGEKNINQVVEKYGIPKTTLHRWTVKYRNHEKRIHQDHKNNV